MRLLWLKSELLHPVDKGGRIRTYQMLRMLRRDHRITYLSLDDGAAAPDARERATEYADRVETVPHHPPRPRTAGYALDVIRSLATPRPYAIDRYRSSAMARRVRELVASGDVDLVVSDFLVMAVNCPADLGCPAVLFQHNVEADIWRRRAEVAGHPVARAFFRNQYGRMVRFEAEACRRFARVIAVSDTDADRMRAAYGITRVDPVPTGVDTEYFRPTDPKPRTPGSLLFLGSMDWAPNADGVEFFVREVLPRIATRVPGVTLTIVGRDPPPAVRALAEVSTQVIVTGTVPDVRPYLAKAAAMVVPLRVGGGTRLKIYEAMASETPVISTTVGAEGLPLTPGKHLVLGDTPEALADAAVRLLQEPETAGRMAREAAALVRDRFGWARVAKDFAALCEAAGRSDHSRQEMMP